MNTFLKYWMSNDFKYAEICVDMEELQLEILFDGIPTMERNADVKRMYRIDERGSHFILGGIDIKRGNGMTATIVYNEAVIKARALWMIVWDNISI
uniref:FBA_2 domain-containing protein n=1 Tax=Caenorhabditis tropicalis TaxID=1561998 RepID=A0A1I7UZB9_9PELO